MLAFKILRKKLSENCIFTTKYQVTKPSNFKSLKIANFWQPKKRNIEINYKTLLNKSPKELNFVIPMMVNNR